MKILSANRLSDGEAVWCAADQSWAENIQNAEVARDAESEARLQRIGAAAAAANKVVDVDLIDVQLVDGRVVPLRLRERIKASGPSIHSNLGKQARADFVRVS